MQHGVDSLENPRTVQEDVPLGARCILSLLPMLWDSLNINPTYNDPIEVIVEKNPVVVNKILLNESSLMSFSSQNTELPKRIEEPDHSL